MSPTNQLEAQIRQTWIKNAECWTQAVRQQQIASRRLVTDSAIENAVINCNPQTVLDLGCGEGWLTRRLTRQGMQVLGVDAVPALIYQAQKLGEGEFQQLDYEAISIGQLKRQFDLVVCNFSLFGQHSVEALIQSIPHLLNPSGYLVIQTLHPATACGPNNNQDGWRPGSWDGFNPNFIDPAPWYFRREESWLSLLSDSGFKVHQVRSPVHPETDEPVSLILTARTRANA